MDISLSRITTESADVDEYLRIEASVASPLLAVTTDPAEAKKEILEGIAYFIRRDGVTAGLIMYERREGGEAHISELAILPEFQGQGVGSSALALILAELADAPRVTLVTHPDNPARRLYERFGFVLTGERIENYCDTGTPRVEYARSRA